MKKKKPPRHIKKLTLAQKKLVHAPNENWATVAGSETRYEGGMVPKRQTFPEGR